MQAPHLRVAPGLCDASRYAPPTLDHAGGGRHSATREALCAALWQRLRAAETSAYRRAPEGTLAHSSPEHGGQVRDSAR